MPKVIISIEEDYPSELRDRLASYDISVGQLSRETGINRSQLARLFNSGVIPRLDTVIKIELAVAKLRAEKKKVKKRG